MFAIRSSVLSKGIHPLQRSFHASAKFMNSDAKLYNFSDIQSLIKTPNPSKVLIDVREPQELQSSGYIPTSINIPFKSTPGGLNLPSEEFEEVFQIPKPSKDKELIFYCHSGIRSTAAEELAKTFGYDKRGNYVGSFQDWVENKGEVAKK